MSLWISLFYSFYASIQRTYCRIHQWIVGLLGTNYPKNNITILDGFRGIACLFVVAFHINLITRDQQVWSPYKTSHPFFSAIMLSGVAGVTLFFVLSGFLLFLPYARALLFDRRWPSARFFYLRRAFRIIPAYYVCLLLLVFLTRPEFLHSDHLKDLSLFLIFFMDSSHRTFQQLNGPFWSLAVEWQYYLLLPFLALVLRLLVRRSTIHWRFVSLNLFLLVIILWGIGSRACGLYFEQNPTATFVISRPMLNTLLFFVYGVGGKYLEDFASGMLLALCYVYTQENATSHRLKQWLFHVSPWLWRTGILLLVFMTLWHYNQTTHMWSVFEALSHHFDIFNEIGLSVGFSLCIAAVLFDFAAVKHLFMSAPLRLLGMLSFSLYMWHLPLLIFFIYHVANYMLESGWHPWAVFFSYWFYFLMIIVPLSALSYLWVEKPCMQFGNKFR